MDRRDFLKVVSVGGVPVPGSELVKASTARSHAQARDDQVELNPAIETNFILIACGGAGIAMTKTIDKVAYGTKRIVALDTDKQSLRYAHHCDSVYWLRNADGSSITTGDEAWQAAEQQSAEISRLIGNADLAIIVTGLGGNAGFGLPYMAARTARQSGALTFAFATLPLAYENEHSESLAEASKALLNEEVHNLVTYDHRVVDRCIPASSRYSPIYNYAEVALRQFLWNTARCLSRYGMVGIDFEDVRTVLCHKSFEAKARALYSWPTSKLGWGTAKGKDRAEAALLKALQHPLLEIERIKPLFGFSVSVRASRKTLKMREINLIMSHGKRHCEPDTHVIFSADWDDTLDERIEVSAIAVPDGGSPTQHDSHQMGSSKESP